MSLVYEALAYLGDTNVSYLATSVDNQPYVRAMMLIKRGNRLFYATGSTEPKSIQITHNPMVEICVLLGDTDNEGSLRLRGKAEFVPDEDMRAEIHGCVGFIESFWDHPQDPAWALIEIKPEYLELMRPGTMDIEKTDI
jgi:uncharacterized pyridoxamine 5'-phosphate oxidase family protein